MVRIVGIGDNVVDKYLELGKMFPGGNALNVAVMAHRSGASTAYLSWLGTDEAGRHIYKSLENEGVDVSHIRIIDGPNAYDVVTLKDGDREFIGNDKGVFDQFSLSASDYDFLSQFDLVHTSVHSFVDKIMFQMRKVCKLISFDYSDIDTVPESCLDMTLPYIDYAIFSGKNKAIDEIKHFQKQICARGPQLVLVTRGYLGSILYYDGRYYEQSIVPTDVVDTLGAGDTFIARFLVGFLEGEEPAKALQHAAEAAAETCRYYGAFGYPAALEVSV